MSFDTTLLSEETRNAINAARTALANDPINKTIALVAKASGGKQVGLTFNVTLGEPDEVTNDTPATKTTPAKAATKTANTGDYGPPASEVRAKAEAAGFDLGDRSLRSKADKLAAMAEIDAFIANGKDDSEDDSEDTSDEESVEEVVDDLLRDLD